MTEDVDGINFYLKVVSREGILYEGETVSITSYNDYGIFDVLAQHANFISLINRGVIIKDKKNEERNIKFDNALLKVFKNNVEIYVGVEGMSPSNLKQSHYTVNKDILHT